MRQGQGFDEPSISNNEVLTLRRVVGQLTEYINNVYNILRTGNLNVDVHIKDLYVDDIVMSESSLYLGRKTLDRKISLVNRVLGFAGNQHLPSIDEDDMVSDSNDFVSTQQSVKAYIGTSIQSEDSILATQVFS